MPIKKAALILVSAVFFISCGNIPDVPDSALSAIADADPQKAGQAAVNGKTMQWEFYNTASGSVSYSGLFEGTVKTTGKKVFKTDGMKVVIKGLDGAKREITPAALHDIAYSKNGRYLCFTMRLGTSPNITAGILDLESGVMAVNFELSDRRAVIGERTFGIAMQRLYRRPRLSDSARYFACSEFEAGKSRVCIYDFPGKNKISCIESGEMAAFMGDDLYYADLSASPAALMKISPPFTVAEKIGEIEGRLIDSENGGKRLFFTTTDYVYKVEDGILSKAADIKETGKEFDVFEVVTAQTAAAKEDETYLFLTVKRHSQEGYSWKIYAGRF
jgi:hypothetical protein